MIRTVIVDDHPLVRAGLRALLATAADIELIAEYADGKTFLEGARRLDAVDVVLLDLTMRLSDGIEVLERLRTWRQVPRVLVLSMHPEKHYAQKVMQLGAHGYVTKDVEDEMLLKAIRTVAWGGTFLSPDAYAMLLVTDGDDESPDNSLHTLSDQERRVFALLRQGLTVKEVAEELDLARNTASTYKARLMAKLGATSIVDLLRFGDNV